MSLFRPFDYSSIAPDSRGVSHYLNRRRSLIEMLRASVELSPDAEALVEIGGPRLTYQQLWDAASRVAMLPAMSWTFGNALRTAAVASRTP